MVEEFADLVGLAKLCVVEMLQARQETVLALHLPLNFERALCPHFDTVVESLQVRRLIFYALVLCELILETKCQFFAIYNVNKHYESNSVIFYLMVEEIIIW